MENMEINPEQLSAIQNKAKEGDTEAQYELGWRHALGMGAELDDEVALQWLARAAAGQHPLAQNNLGARYYSGDGVKRDILEAYLWFYRAAAQHDRKAAKNRDAVFKQLNEAQKQRARDILGPELQRG